MTLNNPGSIKGDQQTGLSFLPARLGTEHVCHLGLHGASKATGHGRHVAHFVGNLGRAV